MPRMDFGKHPGQPAGGCLAMTLGNQPFPFPSLPVPQIQDTTEALPVLTKASLSGAKQNRPPKDSLGSIPVPFLKERDRSSPVTRERVSPWFNTSLQAQREVG